jgi:hypothetical protein
MRSLRQVRLRLVLVLSRRTAKFALASCLLALSAYAGVLVPVETYLLGITLALALVMALLVMGLQIGNRFLGLAILIVTAVVAPYQFGGTERAPLNSAFLLAAFLCLMWLAEVVLLRRTRPMEANRLTYSGMAFLACGVIAFLIGQIPRFDAVTAPLGAQAAQLMIFVLSVGLFLIVPDLIGTIARLQRLAWLFLGAGALCLLADFGGRVAAGPVEKLAGIVHTETLGSVFWIWLVAIGLSQALFNRDLSVLARLGLLSLTLAALLRGLVLARSWTSGWLPPLVVVLVLLFFLAPRLAVVTGALAGVALLFLVSGIGSLTPDEEQYSAVTRLGAAQVLWPLIKAHPLLGLGPANYYYQVSTLPIMGWYVRFSSHNQYIDLAAQVGFLGLAAFLWLVGEMGRAAWRLREHFQRGFSGAYLLGALAGLAGTVVSGALADWILPFYYNIGVGGLRSSLLFWVFMGSIMVLRRASRESVAPEAIGVAGAPLARLTSKLA